MAEKRGVMTELKATVHYGGNDFFIGVSPSGHAQTIETNGDRGSAASPIELLLIAVGSCMASDVVDILRKKREHVTDYRIEVKGERREDFPRSFRKIQLHHILTGYGLSPNSVEHAISLSDSKYCSVAATLRPSAEVSVTYEIVQAHLPVSSSPAGAS
jgi:putative redox protein